MSKLSNHLIQNFSPEAEVLLCAARVCLDEEEVKRLRELLEKGLDWNRLLELARAHGMRPLLFRHLTQGFAHLLPAEVLEHLTDEFRSNGVRNLFMTRQLLNILEEFERHGIEAIAYKGPVMAESIYGDLSLRKFVDLDVLVRLTDVARAKKILSSLGYTNEHAHDDAQVALFERYHCEYQFKHERHGTLFELQWGIAPRFFSLPLRYADWWERAETVPLMERPVRTLAPEDLLLVLCIHGGKHMWERLEWICGVAEVIRQHPNLKWDEVLRRASLARSKRMLLLGLFLAHKLLGARLPEDVLREVEADKTVAALAAETCKNLFPLNNESADEVRITLFHLKAREMWRDRLRYCYRLATTSTVGDWGHWPSLQRASLLYFPVRSVRLTRKYAPRVVRSFWDRYQTGREKN